MKLTTQEYSKVTVVELNGDFTGESVSIFQKKIEDLITPEKEGIVLDFSNVGYIDSRGLESLIWIREICSSHLIQLKLAGLDENCAKILEITRLDQKFDRYSELAEAVKSFA